MISVFGNLIAESIPLIFNYHIYVADAIQICSCKQEKCNLFVTFDKKLREIAMDEGIEVI
ncbi:MAG TPA: PIN domain-containing protein [Archaeoglobaceae archaeon]|nr:PIN domain-containing protein [Archaeoglobaceae archaeon]